MSDDRTYMSLVLSLQVIAGRVRLHVQTALNGQHFSLNEAQEILERLSREIATGRRIEATLQKEEE